MIRRFVRTLGALLLACAGLAVAATSDDVNKISRLFTSGRANDAFTQLDKLLTQQPHDSQLRFLKGVLLAESGRRDEAATVFEQLTIDFPDMPEPYNNLAVIYAAEGKYDQALTALQAAVRAQPGYAVAQQNLGDVYVQLARISYLKAQKLDPGDATIAPKIAALRSSVTPLGTAAPAGAAVPH